jgi:hypothetical protein
MHHMTAYWCPRAQAERDQLCYGVWGTLGSTGRWPQVVNMWEYRGGWDGLARSFEHETSNPVMQDPFLQEWWRAAAAFRSGGYDRVVVPEPWARNIEQLVADGVRGVAYAHELITVPPGRSLDVLAEAADVGRVAVEGFGLELIGGFNVALRNDTECLLLWAIPEWAAWAGFETAWSSHADALRPWQTSLRNVGADLNRMLLVDSPLNPMKNGRQPIDEDRRPLADFFPPLD